MLSVGRQASSSARVATDRNGDEEYSQTTIIPPFGPPPKRAPIKVIRNAKRKQALQEARQGRRQQPYVPAGPVQVPPAQLPPNFDWRVYLDYHPELAASGIQTQQQAEQHYCQYGRQEGRLYRRQRVIMRYIAGTGLTNQHYCHIDAFAIAAAVGAELVLPPAAKRDSFGLYFSTVAKDNQVSWAPAALDGILDVAGITAIWQAKGMALHRVRRGDAIIAMCMRRACMLHAWSRASTSGARTSIH